MLPSVCTLDPHGVSADVADGKAILNLPGRTVSVVDCPFDDHERAFYSAVEEKMDAKLKKVSPCYRRPREF